MLPPYRICLGFLVTIIGILIVSFSLLAMSKKPDNNNENLAASFNQFPRPDHVVIVIEENKSFKRIIGNIEAPYINHLAYGGAVFTNSFAITHPSQPNYLALFSGSTHGVTDDQCPISLTGDNLANQLQKNGLSFTIYSESMPSIAFDGCASVDYHYERKHNPTVNWLNKSVSPEVNMPFGSFPTNYAKLPTVSIVIPNEINNMHGIRPVLDQISQGDDWLNRHLDDYLQWAKTNNSLLIVTWDEDDGTDNNHIPTIFIGPMVKPGHYANRINHYNVLRTIINMYGLSPIGHSLDIEPITEVWMKSK